MSVRRLVPRDNGGVPEENFEAHPMSDLDAHGLDYVARLLGADAVGEIRNLGSNTGCAVHRVELRGEHCPRAVVIKRFPANSAWEPGLEWLALAFAHQEHLPSPEPLHFDGKGACFGSPTLVMSCLPGRPILTPDDLDWWTAGLAAGLTAIHDTATQELSSHFQGRSGEWDYWPSPCPDDDARTQAIARSISQLRGMTWEHGFGHCDFHPGNVLFDDGRLAGVVDWGVARKAPFLYDIGRCRSALAIWPGGEAPGLFRGHYARLSTRSLDGLAYWDALAGAINLKYQGNWLTMYHSKDVNIGASQFRQRATAFIDDALTQLGA